MSIYLNINFSFKVALHHEEVEDLRKKMLQKQAEYEEQIEIMLQKISQLEKAKSRLQSEAWPCKLSSELFSIVETL